MPSHLAVGSCSLEQRPSNFFMSVNGKAYVIKRRNCAKDIHGPQGCLLLHRMGKDASSDPASFEPLCVAPILCRIFKLCVFETQSKMDLKEMY